MENSSIAMSDRIRFEDDDLRAEFIYQQLFRFHDVQLSRLMGIGEIFGMRRALTEVPGKPLENFVRECRRTSGCEVMEESGDLLSVRMGFISLEYEPQRKCLSILPDPALAGKVLEGYGTRRISLKTQRYWVSSLHFPPLSVFMEMEKECRELLGQYDFLEQWKVTEECRKAESAVREMMAAFSSFISVTPPEWTDCLTFGFPKENMISLSLAEELAPRTGQKRESFRLEDWKTGLRRLLERRMEHHISLLQQRIDRERQQRERLEMRFCHEATEEEIMGISVENRGDDAREHYYLNMMLCKAKGRSPKLKTGEFLDRFRFFVQGRRTTSKLVESAEKCMEADVRVIRDDEGKPTALHFHFELFDAIYDIPDAALEITLDSQMTSEMEGEETRFVYRMERSATHFSVRSLCDCHYRLKEAVTSLSLVRRDILEDQEAFEGRSEGLRAFLAMTGCLLIPYNGEDPLFRMILCPLENGCLRLGLDSCGGPYASVAMSFPLDDTGHAMKLWWSRWKMAEIKASKLRELGMRQKLEQYHQSLGKIL